MGNAGTLALRWAARAPRARAERREGDTLHSSQAGQTPQENLAVTPGTPIDSENTHRTPKDPAQIQQPASSEIPAQPSSNNKHMLHLE